MVLAFSNLNIELSCVSGLAAALLLLLLPPLFLSPLFLLPPLPFLLVSSTAVVVKLPM